MPAKVKHAKRKRSNSENSLAEHLKEESASSAGEQEVEVEEEAEQKVEADQALERGDNGLGVGEEEGKDAQEADRSNAKRRRIQGEAQESAEVTQDEEPEADDITAVAVRMVEEAPAGASGESAQAEEKAESIHEALLTAAKRGDGEKCARLIERGANVATKTTEGKTALMLAAREGDKACLDVLLMHMTDAQVAQRDNKGETALMKVAENGHADCVTALLGKMTATQVAEGDDDGWTALMRAAIEGHVDCVTALLAKMTDAQIVQRDDEKKTALMWAAIGGHAECVTALLASMTDEQVAEGDDEGKTALMWAAKNGHAECVQVLCDRLEAVLISDEMQQNDLYNAVLIQASFVALETDKDEMLTKLLQLTQYQINWNLTLETDSDEGLTVAWYVCKLYLTEKNTQLFNCMFEEENVRQVDARIFKSNQSSIFRLLVDLIPKKGHQWFYSKALSFEPENILELDGAISRRVFDSGAEPNTYHGCRVVDICDGDDDSWLEDDIHAMSYSIVPAIFWDFFEKFKQFQANIYEGELTELFKLAVEVELLEQDKAYLLSVHRLVDECDKKELKLTECYFEALLVIPPTSVYYLWSRYELAEHYFNKEDGHRADSLKEANRYMFQIPRNPSVPYPDELPDVYKILAIDNDQRERFVKRYIYDGLYRNPVHDGRAILPEQLLLAVETDGIVSDEEVSGLVRCLELARNYETKLASSGVSLFSRPTVSQQAEQQSTHHRVRIEEVQEEGEVSQATESKVETQESTATAIPQHMRQQP